MQLFYGIGEEVGSICFSKVGQFGEYCAQVGYPIVLHECQYSEKMSLTEGLGKCPGILKSLGFFPRMEKPSKYSTIATHIVSILHCYATVVCQGT